jgi:hypothetical protein
MQLFRQPKNSLINISGRIYHIPLYFLFPLRSAFSDLFHIFAIPQSIIPPPRFLNWIDKPRCETQAALKVPFTFIIVPEKVERSIVKLANGQVCFPSSIEQNS